MVRWRINSVKGEKIDMNDLRSRMEVEKERIEREVEKGEKWKKEIEM